MTVIGLKNVGDHSFTNPTYAHKIYIKIQFFIYCYMFLRNSAIFRELSCYIVVISALELKMQDLVKRRQNSMCLLGVVSVGVAIVYKHLSYSLSTVDLFSEGGGIPPKRVAVKK